MILEGGGGDFKIFVQSKKTGVPVVLEFGPVKSEELI